MSLTQLKSTFQDFSQSTSLHGFSYLYISNSNISKIVWGIVILTFSGLGIGLLVTNTEDYLSSRIVTNIESSTYPIDVSALFIYL
jgi:hypothetical protein